MVKQLRINACWLSVSAVLFLGDYIEKFEQNWIKAFLVLVCVAGIFAVVFVITSFYSQFYNVRQTERVVRKLIYQDILFQLKKEEKEVV